MWSNPLLCLARREESAATGWDSPSSPSDSVATVSTAPRSRRTTTDPPHPRARGGARESLLPSVVRRETEARVSRAHGGIRGRRPSDSAPPSAWVPSRARTAARIRDLPLPPGAAPDRAERRVPSVPWAGAARVVRDNAARAQCPPRAASTSSCSSPIAWRRSCSGTRTGGRGRYLRGHCAPPRAPQQQESLLGRTPFSRRSASKRAAASSSAAHAGSGSPPTAAAAASAAAASRG